MIMNIGDAIAGCANISSEELLKKLACRLFLRYFDHCLKIYENESKYIHFLSDWLCHFLSDVVLIRPRCGIGQQQ